MRRFIAVASSLAAVAAVVCAAVLAPAPRPPPRRRHGTPRSAFGYYLEFTNLFRHACMLRGSPGVSEVSLSVPAPPAVAAAMEAMDAGHGGRAARLPAEPVRVHVCPVPTARMRTHRSRLHKRHPGHTERCHPRPLIPAQKAPRLLSYSQGAGRFVTATSLGFRAVGAMALAFSTTCAR
jgi:hypothetical protein